MITISREPLDDKKVTFKTKINRKEVYVGADSVLDIYNWNRQGGIDLYDIAISFRSKEEICSDCCTIKSILDMYDFNESDNKDVKVQYTDSMSTIYIYSVIVLLFMWVWICMSLCCAVYNCILSYSKVI